MLPKPDSERPPLPAYASEGKALFHPHVRALFGKAFKLALAGQIFCIVAILICVNVLIGFSFNPNPYQKENMKIAIADADKGGIISLALRKVIDNAASFSLNYKFVDVDEDFGTLQNAVDVGTYTAAFYLYPGSSAALMAALMDPTKPFPNTGTFSYVYDEGRVGPAYNISLGGLGSNIASITTAFLKAGLVAKFGAMNVATNQINIPVLQSPIGVTTVNLHPVPTYGLHNAMGTAMMQLYLVGLINAIALAKVHSEMEGRGIEKNHLLLLNVFHRISSCFFLSLWPIFVVLITGCADTSVVTAKVFFVWWMMLWLGMTVYVAICTWAVRLFGPPMGFMFILVFLMLNVGSSAAAVPVDSLPDFFRLGYGMPFMNLVEASKAILVGSNESTLSRSIGVHFAWIGLIVVVLLVIYNDVIGRLKEWVFSYKMNSREEFAAAIRYQLFPDRDVLAAGKREKKRTSDRIAHEDMHQGAHEGLEEGVGRLEGPHTAGAGVPTRGDDVTDNAHWTGQPPKADRNDTGGDVESYTPCNQSIREGGGGEGGIDDIPESSGNIIDDLVEGPPLEEIISTEVVSLFHPTMKPIFKGFVRKAIGLEIALSIFFFILLLVTYGVAVDPSYYHDRVGIAILNAEPKGSGSTGAGPIGSAFDTVLAKFQPPYKFTLTVLDPHGVTADQAQQMVEDGKYWGVWIVRETASATLLASLPAASTTPNEPAIKFIYDTGRGPGYVIGLVRAYGASLVATYNVVVSSGLTAQAAAKGVPFSSYNPLTLTSPVTAQNVDLHPLPFSGIDGAISGSGIALYLGMIVQIMIVNVSHDPLRDVGVRYDHRILAKAVHFALGCFVLSFWIAVTVLWYGVPMSAHTFFSYWAFVGLGMSAFGVISAMSSHFLGALGTIFNIILFSINQASSGGGFPIELLPPFFQLGLALPYNQIVVGGRYILYGSSVQGQFPRCVGVLSAWALFCLIGAYRLFARRRRLGHIQTKAKRALGMEVAPVHTNPMYQMDNFDSRTKPSPRSNRSGSGGGSARDSPLADGGPTASGRSVLLAGGGGSAKGTPTKDLSGSPAVNKALTSNFFVDPVDGPVDGLVDGLINGRVDGRGENGDDEDEDEDAQVDVNVDVRVDMDGGTSREQSEKNQSAVKANVYYEVPYFHANTSSRAEISTVGERSRREE